MRECGFQSLVTISWCISKTLFDKVQLRSEIGEASGQTGRSAEA